MSVARPASRSLLSRCLATAPAARCSSRSTSRATPAPTQPCHQFHSSAGLAARRKPRFKNVRAVEMGLVTDKAIKDFTDKHFEGYSDQEMKSLETKYSPEQLDAIRAGEAAIDPEDFTLQGRLRTDPYRLPYIDDFSQIRPIVDKRARTKAPPNPKARFMNMDEFAQDMSKWAEEQYIKKMGPARAIKLKSIEEFLPEEYKNLPEDKWPLEVYEKADEEYSTYLEKAIPEIEISDTDVLDLMLERSPMTDNNQGSQTALAPALPNKVPGVAGLYKNPVDPADKGLDDVGVYQDLKKRTGMSVKQIMNINVKVLVHRYVSNQTRLGKVRSSSVIAIAGNQNGWLGIGVAKSAEPSAAVTKAGQLAIRNMRPIPRYENRTIYGNVKAKVSGSVVQLSARPPGFGLRVSHRIFEMCRAAGIQDIAGKLPRSRNPMNTVKATYLALLSQPNPEEIAMGRGKKLVDVRKVYYGGAVY